MMWTISRSLSQNAITFQLLRIPWFDSFSFLWWFIETKQYNIEFLRWFWQMTNKILQEGQQKQILWATWGNLNRLLLQVQFLNIDPLTIQRWLVQGAQPGDSLFLHFSGHGGQVRDTSKGICLYMVEWWFINCTSTNVLFLLKMAMRTMVLMRYFEKLNSCSNV